MTDLEIVYQNEPEDIHKIVKKIGLTDNNVIYYGNDKAKILFDKVPRKKSGKLVLITAMSPTPYGEGKTTVSIGLGDALNQKGKKVMLALRQPSMGPVFGMKGGATGGGYSQVVPMTDINLHFTGDFHAITACNNLLCAAIDNHIKHGNELEIDLDKILFQRCLDVNDRALRDCEIGRGGKINGEVRSDSFVITAASEIMAIFCLATSFEDLREKLSCILVAYSKKNKPIYVRDLKITGALLVLLKDAFYPNLVQTLEHTPTLIHGGPFANIAHGCSSLVATNFALSLVDYVITEAGFGADLGAEKFFDIKCREGELKPNCVVLVATIKALKYHAGISEEYILEENIDSVLHGLSNLQVHIENLQKYHLPIIVCVNKYQTDTEEEIKVVKQFCEEKQIPFTVSTAYSEGGKGAIDLANQVINLCNSTSNFKVLYSLDLPIMGKIEKIAQEIYRAKGVLYSDKAKKQIKELENLGCNRLPICIAKTQYSISDDPTKLGYPKYDYVTVKEVHLYHGAGFITVLLGNIVTMPGLPKCPNYERIDLDSRNNIVGLF